MTVRLYGRTLGHGSLAIVTEGFRGALARTGMLDGVVELDREYGPDSEAPAGVLAHHGVLTGPLAACVAMSRNARHERRWAMVAPNSDRIPDDLAAWLWTQCTDLMVPSRWARDVLVAQYERLSGAPWHKGERNIVTVPHGVAHQFMVLDSYRNTVRSQYASEFFTVAHLATSDRERKGTLPLVVAWANAISKGRLPRRAHLDMILDAPAITALRLALADAGQELPSSVTLHSRVDFSPGDMSYSLSHAHVVCQPSRGEGFGLTPLEARACGVPVVATICTGHSEHMSADSPGVVVVEHGPPKPMDDVPGATAPSVSAEAIEAALVTAYKNWPALEQAAISASSELRSQWAWHTKLAPWLESLKQ